MCEYCENAKYTIRIRVNEWLEQENKFIPNNDFEIYYCPMCGKKLGE